MSIYIALLRGINVGGKNKIKMADLKGACEDIGLHKVQTYIQSGNILFQSDKEEKVLRKKIENQIEAVFNLSIPIVIRNINELESIIANCPFSKEQITEAETTSQVESLYVLLMGKSPTKESVEKFSSMNHGNDQFQIVGRDMYLLFYQSIRNAKLAANLGKLDEQGTVRNWKTIRRLAELAKSMKL